MALTDMAPEHTKLKRSLLGPAIFAVIGSLIVLLPVLVFDLDVGIFLSRFFALPVVFLTLLFIAMRLWDSNRRMDGLAMIAIFGITAFFVSAKSLDLRYDTQWILNSKSYKTQLLSKPENPDEGLKHIEWDGSGFAGVANNHTYLVYDPGDKLSADAKAGPSGKLPGIPCKVVEVQRMESHWYSVQFYTDTSWDDCGLAQ
jgi:hypothetical protein